MADEWGPWIEHDGKGCPCVGKWVEAHQTWAGELFEWEGIAGSQFDGTEALSGSSWHWALIEGPWYKIIRYRIRRPKALQQLIDMVENLPVDERIKEDA